MAKPSPIGEQVARLRVLRAWSQEELAHRAGVAVDTVRKLESGTRGMVRLHTLSTISAALDVELSVALVVPSLLPSVADCGLLAIRTALTSADLVGLAEYAEAGPVPDLSALAASVDTAWEAWQAGQYDVLAATLPDLIAEARHAGARDDWRRPGHRLWVTRHRLPGCRRSDSATMTPRPWPR